MLSRTARDSLPCRGRRAGTQVSLGAISFQFLALPKGKGPGLPELPVPRKEGPLPLRGLEIWKGPRPQALLLVVSFGEVFASPCPQRALQGPRPLPGRLDWARGQTAGLVSQRVFTRASWEVSFWKNH